MVNGASGHGLDRLGNPLSGVSAAANFFVERAKLRSRTTPFASLKAEFIAAKRVDRKSPRYVRDLSYRLAKLGGKFDERLVATIDARELDDGLRELELALTSRRNFRKVLLTAFEFAVTRG